MSHFRSVFEVSMQISPCLSNAFHVVMRFQFDVDANAIVAFVMVVERAQLRQPVPFCWHLDGLSPRRWHDFKRREEWGGDSPKAKFEAGTCCISGIEIVEGYGYT